ncbi:tetratricopeptide repeat protein [Psychroserpens sp.]|uniref:tetratricopeptide repeat protein n=1 Tax=Psychroserpens sp. TaxID=2020870 RepID=UPI001B18A64B|nr:tetratricopeptide repeat protein [Psychroserpens sp.]MBO6606151.1 tetratricopeptide repeat protein [Psychroserpens sp.]MBO6652477.1 tetratricopeptide repeat protein [Psychroserpens sp.]MBO6681751.1 tetratricopeptide repeat protein [Psychroserpens sp.]MBO6749526.1 tetratricopeptide repeat protein [Psychroserpens sp.]MBO6914029.1 tetratricopeptide repeat protein [Psychroserpens sp.]
MTLRNLVVLLSFICCAMHVSAQQSATYTSDLVDYQKALTLYNNQQYQAAQSRFESIKQDAPNETLESDCAYYIANCAVRLNQQNADDLIQDFVDNYPTSTKRNTAILDVGDYYFTNAKYAYARKWYDKVDETSIPRGEREKFYFNYGYSLYATGNETGANKYLNRVVTSKKYGSQAKYYIGYIAYEGDDYDKANEYFEQVSDNEKYQEKLSYYQADLNFKLGNFEKAIELAKGQLDKSTAQEQSELSKIIGESYFNLEQYAEAIPYLSEYKGKRGRWTNVDFYQLGYAYYKQNDFEKAISEFNKIIGGDNSVAQNAYYHLGESYINVDKKQEALNAFRNASQMDYDLKIQEDAWLNYAKISYEIGNPYQSVPQVLSGYLDKYPDTSYKEEIETLLIDSYITSKNYKEAIKLLEGKRSFENRLAYQKVAFYRGIELYNENNYLEAEAFFDKSISEAKDPLFTTRATFWKAETDYHLTNFNDALIGFKQFEQQSGATNVTEYENIDYNIAYTYFKLKNYDQSSANFKRFISNHKGDKLRLNDAYLRLGDGYFVSSKYSDAIAAYDKAIAINEIESDYASFQKTMSYGYLGQASQKIQGLRSFIEAFPRSALRDDALYELANSYIKSNDFEQAMAIYNKLISEYRTSKFISKALLRQGLAYYNKTDNERALSKFKKVANDYPSTPEASQAVATARLIYIDLGRVDEYAAWVRTLDYVDVTDAELDNTAYLAAEKQYLDNRTDAAIRQFNKYLNEFPNGIHAFNAHFYLAELYSKKDLPENARPHYEYVVSKPKTEFTEQAMVKLSQIYLNTQSWDQAIDLLQRLEQEADYPQNVTYAQSNLMNAFYQQQQYTEAVDYAEKVLQQSKIDNKVKSDAQIIIARSAIKTGDEDKAKDAYAQVEKIATGALAAEALFYNAFFKNKEGNYQASNTTVQKLASDYSSYKYYSAKGLVLMAKNYDALGDAFQATYILESVITNFSEFDDVVAEAQSELSRIKTEEAKTNASVESDQN